jgi:DNA-binding response OmpR family regulator
MDRVSTPLKRPRHAAPNAGNHVAAPGNADAEASSGGKKVTQNVLLLVEDNHADVFLVEQAIEFHQVPVSIVVAEDGEIACQYFDRAERDENTPCPTILVLDLNLPKRSGNEVLERVRMSSKCGDVPVVIMTSSDSPDDRRNASRLGADRYFRKPTSYREFMEIGALLNEVLKERVS